MYAKARGIGQQQLQRKSLVQDLTQDVANAVCKLFGVVNPLEKDSVCVPCKSNDERKKPFKL